MKAQEFTQQQNASGFFSSTQSKCKQNNKSENICQNKNCQKHPFLCPNRKCQCRTQHKKCIIIDIQNFISSIQSKLITLKPIEQIICDKIQKAIDQLSNFRDRIIDLLTQQFQSFGLSTQQKSILKALKQGNTKHIHGKQIWNISFNFQQPNEAHQKVQQLQTQIDLTWTQLSFQIKSSTQSILKQLQQFMQNANSKQGWNPKLMFKNSKIIKSAEQSRNLINFFDFSPLKKANLLYRASQNQFSIPKFFQKCSNIPHTICIAQTQYGKILGGYTPLAWFKSRIGQYAKDESQRSFLFSLTNNDKFQIANKQKAIYRRNNAGYGPTFGGGYNFTIQAYSFIGGSNTSYFEISPQNYNNPKYSSGSKQIFQKLSGNPNNSNQFKVKQWQVWSLEFIKQ